MLIGPPVLSSPFHVMGVAGVLGGALFSAIHGALSCRSACMLCLLIQTHNAQGWVEQELECVEE